MVDESLSLQAVTQPHKRSYDDPISLSAGDRVRITQHDLWDEQYEWLWCISSKGKEGWVPATYLDVQNGEGQVLREYSAMELTVTKGEIVTVLSEESGWYWCKNAVGITGWVPVRCFD